MPPVAGTFCPKFEQLTSLYCWSILHSFVALIHWEMNLFQIALSVKKAAEDYVPLDEGSEAHWEVVERILFLYAKLNPGQGYVQGMNEIIGPIYYAFASDPDASWRGENHQFPMFGGFPEIGGCFPSHEVNT